MENGIKEIKWYVIGEMKEERERFGNAEVMLHILLYWKH